MRMAIKLLIGGSPCTHWSIAQKNNRETEPSGQGWELFKNYLIAKEKFQPDFFLYENNKSMAKAIKEQITNEFGVEPYLINSALVSAQNRQRYYWMNVENIPQPEDRGILLRDILETGEDLTSKDKSYCLTASYNGACAWNTIERSQRTMVAEPVALNTTTEGKAQCIRATCYKDGIRNMVANNVDRRTCVAIPVCMRYERNAKAKKLRKQYEAGEIQHGFNQYRELHPRPDGKTNTLSTVLKDNPICEPVTGLHVAPIEFDNGTPTKAISGVDGKEHPVYEVQDGKITIKEKTYPIKLADGFYIIRKLTVTECCRLQTMPDDYCKAVSATQGYKGLGNGWTAEVIIHLLNHALKDIPKDEEIIVLSMFDGIGTGRYCLDKMGFTNIKYYAYEINKFAMKVANDNYPDIIQCGDAFAVREDGWRLDSAL